MITTNESLGNIAFLIPSQSNHILQPLAETLSAYGYTIHTQAQLNGTFNDYLKHDALVLSDATPPESFTKLPIREPITQRPLLCLITQDDTVNDDDFDLVLPHVSPAFLLKNITKLLTYRRQLITARLHQDEINLLKNAIVRNVSHELKTPLLQVKSAVALIAEEDVDEKLARMAVQATARLEAVVKNITLLADSLNGSVEPFILSESLDQAIRNLRRIWLHKDAISRIHVQLNEPLPLALGDKQALGIVMQQLLDNALKFSQDAVTVTLEACDEGIRFSITDQGIGIAPDKIQQIFESFYQVDNSTTRRYGGTGVGLAIVRLIMEKHDTEIQVTSRIGEGSTFSFVLPAALL